MPVPVIYQYLCVYIYIYTYMIIYHFHISCIIDMFSVVCYIMLYILLHISYMLHRFVMFLDPTIAGQFFLRLPQSVDHLPSRGWTSNGGQTSNKDMLDESWMKWRAYYWFFQNLTEDFEVFLKKMMSHWFTGVLEKLEKLGKLGVSS